MGERLRFDHKAFNRGVSDAMTLAPLRWWMFKRLSAFGWWICPEPHKSRLQSALPTWDDVRASLKQEERT